MTMMKPGGPAGKAAAVAAAAGAALLAASPASADLVVSQLVVEFRPGGPRTADLELFNDSDERSYVAVEPREVLHAGTEREQGYSTPDPAKLGLLASPQRLILEPRQRRTLRIAAIGAAAERERVYRVTVKPVAGEVTGSETGLKLLVGYDLLVLARPAAIRGPVRARRTGSSLTLVNEGNASVELADGKQCSASGSECEALPARRLYSGASWTQQLPRTGAGEYRVRTAEGWSRVEF